MESRVHDVEEHFRRSLQQINRDNPPSSRNERRVFEQESHHITVSENSKQQISAAPSPVQTTPTLSPTSVSSQQQGDDSLSRGQTSPMLVNPQQQGAPPPLVLSIPTGSVGTKPEPLKSYNEVLSLAATQQLLTAATLGQSITGTGGRGILFPNVLPVSQSNFIPVIDSNGVTQLMASPATHSSSLPAQGVPPIVFLGPGNIPLLPATQPGMYLLNTSADVQQQQQQQSPATTVAPSLSAVTTQPSYIVFPQSFQMPQTLTLEQLQALSATIQQQKQQDQQQVDGRHNIETQRQTDTIPDGISSRPSNHNINGDEVEEHFARALGEKWQQFKKDGSPQKKIST